MKVFSLFLAFNVLIASTGLSLHTHTCSASNTIAVDLSETDCHKIELSDDGCCRSAESCNSEESEDGCCTNDQEYYKEDLVGIATKGEVTVPAIYPAVQSPVFQWTFVEDHNYSDILDSGQPPGAFRSPPTALLQVFRC